MKHEGAVTQLKFSRDSNWLATADCAGTARLWSAADGTAIGQPMRLPRAVTAISFSRDGDILVTGCDDGTLQRWNTRTTAPVGARLKLGAALLSVVAVGPGEKNLLANCADGVTRFWNADDGKPIGQSAGIPIDPSRRALPALQMPLRPIELDPQGGSIPLCVDAAGMTAVIGIGRLAQIWSCSDGIPIGRPMEHQARITTAQLSTDARTVLTASADGEARLWRAADGAPIGQPMRHAQAITTVEFSPDGRTLLTGSEDGTARVWSAVSGGPIGFPMKHPGPIWQASYCSDGAAIVTFGAGNARLWAYPEELPGDPLAVTLWVQCVTGVELSQPGDVFHRLDDATLAQRRQQLRDRGGQALP
jgi:WD40 repeat protein